MARNTTSLVHDRGTGLGFATEITPKLNVKMNLQLIMTAWCVFQAGTSRSTIMERKCGRNYECHQMIFRRWYEITYRRKNSSPSKPYTVIWRAGFDPKSDALESTCMDIDMYGVGDRFPDFEAQTHVAQRETFEEWQWDVQVVSLCAIPLPPTPTINELFIVISMSLY